MRTKTTGDMQSQISLNILTTAKRLRYKSDGSPACPDCGNLFSTGFPRRIRIWYDPDGIYLCKYCSKKRFIERFGP